MTTPTNQRYRRLRIGLILLLLVAAGILASRMERHLARSPASASGDGRPAPDSGSQPARPPVLPPESPVAGLLDPDRFSYEGAIRDLAVMSRSLDPREQRALLREIGGGMPVALESGLESDRVHHLANECVFALLRQESPLPELAAGLVARARDPRADPVLRDYAVQALGEWLEWPRTRESGPEGTAANVVEALFGFAYDRESALAGTALLALDRTASLPESSRPGELVSPVLLEVALRAVATDPTADPSSRASALLVGQRHDFRGIADFARALLADPQSPPVVRAAAATVLGSAGSWPDDRGLLEPLADPSDNSRLAFASRAALARLGGRP